MSENSRHLPASASMGGADADALARPASPGVTRLVVGLADMAWRSISAARPGYARPPGRPALLQDAVLGVALEVQRRSVSVAADAADRAGRLAGAATRMLVPEAVRGAVERSVGYWGARGVAERVWARQEARLVTRALIGAVTAAVVEETDLDAVADRLDVDRVAERVDLDALLTRVDLDAVLARIDLDAVLAQVDIDGILDRVNVDTLLDRVDIDGILDRVDIDGILDRVDVDTLLDRVNVDTLLGRVDVDTLLDRVNVDMLLDRVDVDTLLTRIDLDAVIARIDVNALVDRVDVDRVARRVDVDAVLARVALATYVEEVLREVDVGRIVRDTGDSITAETLDAFREQNARADRFVDRITGRLLHRGGPNGGPAPIADPPDGPGHEPAGTAEPGPEGEGGDGP
ncbi:hypothetical protein ACWEN3_27465 [Streptomyces sp. NPDC004561]